MSLTPQEIQYYEEHADQSLQPNELAAYIIGYVLALTAVGFRCYARWHTKLTFEKDDYFIIAALAPFTAYFVAAICAVAYGEGKHIIFVTNPKGFVECFITCIVAYSIATVLTKASVLFLYQRMFHSQKLKHISLLVIVFAIMYNSAVILTAALECIPLSVMWTGKPGRCINSKVPFTILGVINVLTDCAILTIPVTFVMRLKMDTWRKVQVSAIFLTGGIVCFFGIIRVAYIGTSKDGDASYNQTYPGIWSYCEMFIGFIAACMPCYGMFLSKARLTSVSTSYRHIISSKRSSEKSSKKRNPDSSLFKSTIDEEAKEGSIGSENNFNAEPTRPADYSPG